MKCRVRFPTRHRFKHLSKQQWKDIVVFFHKKSQLVIINFLLKNKDIFILFFLDTDLKGTVVSQAYPS